MIFKILIYGCAILSLWPRIARSQSDVDIGNSNFVRSSVPGSVQKRFMDNKNKGKKEESDADDDDIDHVKLLRRMDSVERNVNVNVNHYDPSMIRWTKLQGRPLKSSRQPGASKRDDHSKRLDQIYQVMHMIPHSNIDYNLAHPLGYVNVQKPKYSPLTSQTLMMDDSEESLSNEDNDKQCQSIVYKAAEYLRKVEINLRNLDRDLKSLMKESPNSFEDYQDLETK